MLILKNLMELKEKLELPEDIEIVIDGKEVKFAIVKDGKILLEHDKDALNKIDPNEYDIKKDSF